MLEVGQLNIVK